jgi:hypothetical protein
VTLDGGVDTAVFEASIEHALAPALHESYISQ